MAHKARNIPIYFILIVLVLLWILPVWTTFLVSFKSSTSTS